MSNQTEQAKANGKGKVNGNVTKGNNENTTVKDEKEAPVMGVVKPTEEQEQAAKERVIATLEKFEMRKPTAEERIENMNQFKALSERYGFLKNKANELKTFVAGDTKTKCQLTIINEQGYKFEINNTNVIAKIVLEASKELETLLTEARNEVEAFEI